ncbi:MAG TPA: glycosyltransferase family A protein [Burkholderiales bacterium]|nr:glycosyltransferase family A protein [Burkholderiales bacterium]
MLITAVIPTRNRAEDLARAVLSVCAQTRLPDELIVIDQSAATVSRERVLAALAAHGHAMKVDYVLDPQIAGLVAAKKAAVERAHGDIVCFLEDDVVLEPDYLRNIEAGFVADPEMVGSCGIVSNLPPLGPYYFALFHFFHRGIFHDARVGVTGVMTGSGHPLIPSEYLSGGLSAYRRVVFETVPFDIENGFFALEDVDFSTRVARAFGPRLYINPNARLEHRMSPANRAVLGPRQERKVREFLVFYKKRRAQAHASDLGLIVTGLLLEAVFQALQQRSIGPIPGFVRGLWRGARWKVVDA